MKKQLALLVLLVAGLGLSAVPVSAQVATTGPAGLARQMPRIYGPYMANRSRIKNQQKHKTQQRHARSTRTRSQQH